MVKTISSSFMPILKSTSVAAASAALVISIQASADGHKDDGDGLHNTAKATPAAVVKPRSSSQGPWTPANGFADLIEDVSPAVVHVATAGFIEQRGFNPRGGRPDFRGPQGFEEFFEWFNRRGQVDPRQQQPEQDLDSESDEEKQTRPLGIGSGFIISADGYVVTNHHVVNDADEIIVTMTDGTEYKAEIKGSDPQTDLALLKLEDASDLSLIHI